jgi:hypothetical protein
LEVFARETAMLLLSTLFAVIAIVYLVAAIVRPERF